MTHPALPGDPGDPNTSHDALAVAEEPIPNPGMDEHQPRPTDIDPEAERRAERQVATFFALSGVSAVLFVVCYFLFSIGEDTDLLGGYGASNVTLGLFLGLALLFIGVGAIQWSRKLMSDVEISEQRHPAASPPEDREAALTAFSAGVDDSGIARRPLIRNSLIGSLALLGLPVVVLLRDLGPLPGSKLASTVWTTGMRLVNDIAGTPIKPSEIQIGQLINGEPAVFYEENEEGEPIFEGVELLQAKAKAAIIIVRIEPEDITPSSGRENWGIDGILCYSKICTHVGCPISLYEQQTHLMLCPCHQSTFDLADSGKVIFGPAARSLPQLPIMIDDEGYLVAQSDFTEPVGPSYWERG